MCRGWGCHYKTHLWCCDAAILTIHKMAKWPFLSRCTKLWDRWRWSRRFDVLTSRPSATVPKFGMYKHFSTLADIKWWAKLPFDQIGAIGMESLKWTALNISVLDALLTLLDHSPPFPTIPDHSPPFLAISHYFSSFRTIHHHFSDITLTR